MADTIPAIKKRNCIQKYIEQQLIGPMNGVEEVVGTEPCNYYISGILFPLDRSNDGSESYLSLQETGGKDEDSDILAAEQVSTLSGKIFPSSMGIHSLVEGEVKDISIVVNYALYAKTPAGWKRAPQPQIWIPLSTVPDGVKDIPTNESTGYVRVVTQNRDGQIFVKVYVVNTGAKKKSSTTYSPCIYQPVITLESAGKSHFVNLGRKSYDRGNLEDRISFLRHRKHKVFARGYGCAAVWEDNNGKTKCRSVSTTFLPEHEIRPLRYDVEGADEVLSQHFLSYGLKKNKAEAVRSLKKFVVSYETWTSKLLKENPDIDPNSIEADEVIKLCKNASVRMNAGIELIASNEEVYQAFILTNLAMIMQSANRRGAIHFKDGDDPWNACADLEADQYSWRPFQLAFVLLSIPPAFDLESEYRKIVDLIWFPTGGGKTEAYLGVMAFTILFQRIQSPGQKFGTTVLSRYTMRLLTAQQFERTAALVSVLHVFSNIWSNKLGGEPVTLGIWHGPNPKLMSFAEEMISELKASDCPLKDNKFAISKCPVCNNNLLPEKRSGNSGDYGFKVVNNRMTVVCLDEDCPMHLGIPVCMVDQQIYEELPSVVIGTIDKFARLAWKKEPGWLLTGRNHLYPPPSLIIQDELHLIAGPLGSLAGVYETAIEALCSSSGTKPHIIASTATVRRADDQCMALYGRHVRQFPPPGLDEADSFFARKDFNKDGRKYLGVLPSHVTPTTAAVRLHAILYQASKHCEANNYDDNYSTIVSYFNSIKELGVATTLAADDIPDRLKIIEPDKNKRRKLSDSCFSDLYSDRSEAELAETMRQLELKKGSKGALGLLLSTNIISVGIDVDRLGLMLVNGQPKTTAEYIQASSRVGRTSEMPGLVVTLYGAMKPRDRSHFENFIPYHSTLYGSVEPTSVTPFSKPSRERALHAIIIILARNLAGGLPENFQANGITNKQALRDEITEIIHERLKNVAPDELTDCLNDIKLRFEEWESWASGGLHYEAINTALTTLLHRRINPPANLKGWRTMDSMRNVDFESRIVIMNNPRL